MFPAPPRQIHETIAFPVKEWTFLGVGVKISKFSRCQPSLSIYASSNTVHYSAKNTHSRWFYQHFYRGSDLAYFETRSRVSLELPPRTNDRSAPLSDAPYNLLIFITTTSLFSSLLPLLFYRVGHRQPKIHTVRPARLVAANH
jgi:hypothetical protein